MQKPMRHHRTSNHFAGIARKGTRANATHQSGGVALGRANSGRTDLDGIPGSDPEALSSFCQSEWSSLRVPWYCPELEKTRLDYMGLHAREVAAEIADTVITQKVHRELEFARAECVPVPFVGESRFGKTKSLSNWCDMYPGRARLVTVPNDNREIDFMRAHADAFGIDYTPATTCSTLKDKVEFVVARSRLMVVYDEAHARLPINYHQATPPRRLNWIRSKVIGRGIACAFFATPQSYKQTLAKWVEDTGYRVEQWLGRLAPTVILSDVIPVEEVIEAARPQFPELTQSQLEELADRAILSDGYLKRLEMAGKRARFLARERSHSKPTTPDALAACADMMSEQPRIITEPMPRIKAVERKPAAQATPPRGDVPAQAAPRVPGSEFPRRSTTPARLIQEPVTVG